MDLSKLKPMSQTPSTPRDAQIESETPVRPLPLDSSNQTRASHSPSDDFGLVAIWISLIMGVIALALGQRFGSWLLSYLQGKPFHTNVRWESGPLAGTEVAFFDLANHAALTEAGFFLLGVVLMIDVVLMLLARRGLMSSTLISIALALILVTIVFNLYVTLLVYQSGMLPLYSLMAVLTAGIVFFGHLDSLKLLKHRRAVLERAERTGATDGSK